MASRESVSLVDQDNGRVGDRKKKQETGWEKRNEAEKKEERRRRRRMPTAAAEGFDYSTTGPLTRRRWVLACVSGLVPLTASVPTSRLVVLTNDTSGARQSPKPLGAGWITEATPGYNWPRSAVEASSWRPALRTSLLFWAGQEAIRETLLRFS